MLTFRNSFAAIAMAAALGMPGSQAILRPEPPRIRVPVAVAQTTRAARKQAERRTAETARNRAGFFARHRAAKQEADERQWNRIMNTFTNHERVVCGSRIRAAVGKKDWKQLLPLLNRRQRVALGMEAL